MRLTNNDRKYGPFVYGTSENIGFSIRYDTGDGGDESFDHNSIILNFGKHVLMLKLPMLIKPYEKTIKYGDKTYTDLINREWSVGYFDKYIIVRYGVQDPSLDGSEKVKCFELPWLAWTWVRKTVWDCEGNLLYVEKSGESFPKLGYNKLRNFRKLEETCKKKQFQVLDYDGAPLTASVYVAEMEWHRGRKLFAWMKYFTKPLVCKYLEIEWSDERGPRKGDWKGGIVAESWDMLPNESIEDAFKRFCSPERVDSRSSRDAPVRLVEVS